MRLSFCLSIFAACLLVPSIAAADDDGFSLSDYDTYVGVEPGRATITPSNGSLALYQDLQLIIPDDRALTVTHSSSLSSTSKEVEAGIWFNSDVGMQIGYLDMGTFSQSTHYHDPHSNICLVDCSFASTSDFTDINKVSVSGVVLTVEGRVQLPEGFELLGRLGMFVGNIKYEEDTPGLPAAAGGSSSASTAPGDIGVGLGWRFSSHWGVELWWDRYPTMGNPYADNSTRQDQFSVEDYSLAVQYHF
jgi:Outer membrane protein beta-barrel domain